MAPFKHTMLQSIRRDKIHPYIFLLLPCLFVYLSCEEWRKIVQFWILKGCRHTQARNPKCIIMRTRVTLLPPLDNDDEVEELGPLILRPMYDGPSQSATQLIISA